MYFSSLFRSQKFVVEILRWATFLCLFGWGVLHLFWDGPYRSLFWSQEHMKWFVTGILGISWNEYMMNLAVDASINTLTQTIGVLMLVGAVIILLPKKWMVRFRHLLYLSGFCLFFLALMKFQSRHFQIAMLIEHASQFGIPFVAYFYLTKKWNFEETRNVLKLMLMMTFVGHGLYALGAYPVPGKFIDMVIPIFGVSESVALEFLFVAGAIDVLLCLLIWIPAAEKAALIYCVFWGFLTAMARPVSFMLLKVDNMESLSFWLFQSIYRAPHALVPLALAAMAYRFHSREPVLIRNAGFRTGN